MMNIGHAFVKLGQYSDAAKAYEHLLEQTPVRVCCAGALGPFFFFFLLAFFLFFFLFFFLIFHFFFCLSFFLHPDPWLINYLPIPAA